MHANQQDVLDLVAVKHVKRLIITSTLMLNIAVIDDQELVAF